jgi:GNAT superfamily N-acetyltransferase
MLTISTEFGQNVSHKDQILSNKLHLEENSEILAMLNYDGDTNKSIAYLLDYGAVVGIVYIEHYMTKGTFGAFIHPKYRGKGYATNLAIAAQQVMNDNGYTNQPLEVSERALTTFRRVFGDEYPIAEIL